MLIAPPDSASRAVSLGNLGAAHLQIGSAATALRYLERASRGLAPGGSLHALQAYARVRLNVCAAHSTLGEHYDAIDAARGVCHALARAAASGAGAAAPRSPPPSSSSSSTTLDVMRAIAHHSICTCHEHLDQYEPALVEASHARRLARAALPAEDPLLARLTQTEASIARTLRTQKARTEKLIATGRERGAL